MKDSLPKFHNRAPRYQVKDNENLHVRFLKANSSFPVQGKLFNLSTTGAAILIKHEESPFKGEKVKVELTLPSGKTIAWHAEVKRITLFREPRQLLKKRKIKVSEPQALIGLHFLNLPEGHKEVIQQLTEGDLKNYIEERQQYLFKLHQLDIVQKIILAFLIFILSFLTYKALLYLRAPLSDYSGWKGETWKNKNCLVFCDRKPASNRQNTK